jgi:hypothetical protein
MHQRNLTPSIREIVQTTMHSRSRFASYLPDALDRIVFGLPDVDDHILIEVLRARLTREEMRAFKASQPTRRSWRYGL